MSNNNRLMSHRTWPFIQPRLGCSYAIILTSRSPTCRENKRIFLGSAVLPKICFFKTNKIFLVVVVILIFYSSMSAWECIASPTVEPVLLAFLPKSVWIHTVVQFSPSACRPIKFLWVGN